jgi:hypothetical protein
MVKVYDNFSNFLYPNPDTYFSCRKSWHKPHQWSL